MRIQIITRVPTPCPRTFNTHSHTLEHTGTQFNRGSKLADGGFGALVSDLGKRRSEIPLTRCSFEASHCIFFFFFCLLLCDLLLLLLFFYQQSSRQQPPSPAHTLTCKTALEMFSTLEPLAPLKLHTQGAQNKKRGSAA